MKQLVVPASDHTSHMAFAEPDRAKLVWGELNVDMINTALPFKVSVSAVGEDKQPINNYEGHLTISAVQSQVCLAEGFESGRLGLWCVSSVARTRALSRAYPG